MEIRNWCSSGTCSEIIHLGRDRSSRSSSIASSNTFRSKKLLRWRELWLWIKFKRRNIFESKKPSSLHEPYDSCSYKLNFDHGLMWDEPDNLSRSFSVRFADPSRVLGKKRMVK